MQLKKIRLAGFKSFVDPTTVVFPSQLVGVVGPNGCGKSNVIDAVRWVMGESSAKHLRGDSLQDVIFNGSASRKPVGQATIELVFDNSSGRLGGQYAGFSEISVKRQLSRDGQSVYFLNGTRCRRRDITDVFLGTGLGPRSYAIIEQGTVSRLIEAKPEELRTFLEEAAGISKYKERRRETENRIRDARDNIDRLNDIVTELEKRLATLQRQARAAEKYRELKEEERLVRAQLLALRCRAMDGDLERCERSIAAQENAVEREVAALRGLEAGLEHQRTEQTAANEAFNAVQAEFYRLGSEISRTEQSIQHARERQAQSRRELGELERTREEVKTHLAQDREQIGTLEREIAQDEPERRRSEEAERASAAALAAAEQAMAEWQADWDRYSGETAERTRRIEVERTRIQHLEEGLRSLAERLGRLEAEERGLATESDAQAGAELGDQLAQIEAALESLKAEQTEILERIATERETREQRAAALEEARRERQALETRHASLDALQQVALGKNEGAVAQWLETHGWSGLRRLAEDIQVDEGWDRAVETVLGLDLEAVCVSDLDEVARRIEDLGEGTLAVFATGTGGAAAEGDAPAPRLADRLRAPWGLDGLLRGVYTAETVADAMALRPRLRAGESVVTRGGVWVGPDWLRVVNAKDEKQGVLGREQALREIARELEAAQAALDQAHEGLERSDRDLAALEQAREDVRQRTDGARRREAEVRAQISRRDASLEQIRRRRERLAVETGEVREKIGRDEVELAAARERLATVTDEARAQEATGEHLQRRRDELRATVDAARERAHADRQAARELAVRMESARSRLNVLRDGLERFERQLAQVERQHEALTRTLAESEGPLEEMARALEALLAERLEVEGRLGEARRRLEACDHALRELEGRRSGLEQNLSGERERLEALRLERQELTVRRQGLLDQLQETGHALDALLADLPPEAEAGAWQERLGGIEDRISRMGAINLAAIDEFAEQSERKTYLDAQLADLNEALETLENAIRKIDNETRTRFRETFDRANEHLQALYPRVFGGGMAKLEMTSEDLLEAGVTVMARPPGKRNVNIHQLSGGEKALTAVALVFALFELNPAPFCMLDEVDAPLDDANAARFCNLVREMSDRVQFIVITHNKITMELANQLLGVTMHEPGVSRLVAVDVDEAVEMAG